MQVIAVYNLKGGVGKTAAAVNLADIAARQGHRTLLWDLDPQGAATFYLNVDQWNDKRLFENKKSLRRLIRNTQYPHLDVAPIDLAMRNMDLEIAEKPKFVARLRKMLNHVKEDYDLVLLDCAPALSAVSESVFHAADWVLAPLIPTHLSLRSYGQIERFMLSAGHPVERLLPFFSMVDRRKRLHKESIRQFALLHPTVIRTYIPYSSDIEKMGEHRAPMFAFAPNTPGAKAFLALWGAVASRLGLDAQNA
ncbi:MAG: ParA family protein [Pseudomonadota bacterium]